MTRFLQSHATDVQNNRDQGQFMCSCISRLPHNGSCLDAYGRLEQWQIIMFTGALLTDALLTDALLKDALLTDAYELRLVIVSAITGTWT